MAKTADGRAFTVVCGSCLELFSDTPDSICRLIRTVEQMADTISRATGTPVVEILRIAGQLTKPRSNPTENVGGLLLPAYRGPLVNDPEPTLAARQADERRLLLGHDYSADTLKLVAQLANRQMFTSHEGLLLLYEEALRRTSGGRCMATSAHMPWIGDRTREPNGAHVAFFASIGNPIGVKLGPTATPDEVLGLCRRLDPYGIPGRLSLISRMGANQIDSLLPPLMQAVRQAGWRPVWMSDPMHGNTYVTDSGRKTRDFKAVAEELRRFFAICRAESIWPGGLHLEMTGDDVTECLGGNSADAVTDLSRNYTTGCDPRLNRSQSLDLAGLASELLAQS
jgi:3-deoxy-7-phosphoheptulonate synthase